MIDTHPLRGSTSSLAHALSTSHPSSWRYVAEGGANLVLSYVGPASPSLDGKVIRLHKRKKTDTKVSGAVDPRFACLIVAPLLGEEQVVLMERVPVLAAFLEGLKEALRYSALRPAEREREDEIDETAGFVVVSEDLAGGASVLAIEIKPKWGFLPTTTYLSSVSRDVKAHYCRFCMHAYLKVAETDAVGALERHQTGFCPLDLYSSDESRIGCAVGGLWDGWEASEGAANNFRLFIDGRKVSPNDPGVLRDLGRFFSPVSLETPSRAQVRASLCSSLVPALHSSPLLSTLRSLQSSLDPLDIEGLESLILAATSSASLSDVVKAHLVGPPPSVDEWILWKTAWTSSALPFNKRPLRDLVLAYLLSATFKDCSIFVRLTADGEAKVKVIDLDPKPLDRLAKYRALDGEIVESFRALVDSVGGTGLRRCVK